MGTILKLEDLCYSYIDGGYERQILKNLSFEFEEKKFYTILGPSGSGKTTLLSIIAGLDFAKSGHVYFKDKEITKSNVGKYRRNDISIVFQQYNLISYLTAVENVMMPALIADKNFKQSKMHAMELLEYLGLESRAHHKPAELSGGEKQRVAVARALINNPALILADEPSGSLDSQNKKDLHNLFFNLRKEFGQTILIVTHDNELAEISDRIIKINDGVIAE